LRVLIACEHSGVVREAFRLRGHEAWSCDILPASDGSPYHYQADALDIAYGEDWDLMIAHPPCTALCVTGNRHYAGTTDRTQALILVKDLMDAPIEKIAIENPVGVISSEIRKPDQYIQPWQFGHSVTKKTGLWLANLPKLKPTNIVAPDEFVEFSSGKRMSKWYYETSLLPAKERGHVRSITFQGIADAMSSQWG
jgi:hypothetical protein